MPPKFSIVIPAFNQAHFIGETIESIRRQTLPDFEIIVVNDASPDDTGEVLAKIDDPRLRCLVHEQNKGLPAARNTGMRAAQGEYIALLDADDLFHPQKLEVHAAFLDQHPDVAVTYNPRFDMNYSDTTIRDLTRPPATVGLRDFLFGYPFTPSDMVIRRKTVETVGYFDEFYRNGGEDMEFPAMLALAGCKFASVDRALNYRRHHSGRYRKNLDPRLKDVQLALEKIYADPRCPEEIRRLGQMPLSEHYIVLVYHAFMQDRTEDGQRFLRGVLEFNPGVIEGAPCQVVEYFAGNSIADEKDDHEAILKRLFAQLPQLPVNINSQLDWAIREGYLIKGVRAALWDRQEAAEKHFQKAAQVGAAFSEERLRKVAHQIIDYEIEMSEPLTQAALARLLPHIRRLSQKDRYRRFLGELSARRAFENYHRRQFRRVRANILQTILHNPRYLLNRGIYSIFVRSFIRR